MAQEWMSLVLHLVDYQAYTRGVDRGDQLEDYCNIGRRTTKWWTKVFAYVIQCCLLNSYVLNSHTHPVEHARLGRHKTDFFQFREEASELVGSFSSRKRVGRQQSAENQQLDWLNRELDHFPVHVAEEHKEIFHLGATSMSPE